MEAIRIAALRDFAIAHFPRAQKVEAQFKRMSLSSDHYHNTLFGIAALIQPIAPAIEQAAASLLLSVTGLLIVREDGVKLTSAQRQQTEHRAIGAATTLCSLTNTVIPWLAEAMTDAPTEQPELLPAPIAQPFPKITRPQPGINLSTDEAAQLLKVKPQTMRAWASKENGPLRPIKNGRSNAWPSDEVIRLLNEGWKSRGSH